MRLVVRALEELGEGVVLAPERHVALQHAGDGVPLAELVVERNERVEPSALGRSVVLDTTHARDGVVDLAAALRDAAAGVRPKSAKKRARAGDLVVSRLRPYLRQIAVVRPSALAALRGKPLAVSTEFYVLTPRIEQDDLCWLLPFLLGERAQGALAAAQEGGHHPRVPKSSLFALRVPRAALAGRRALSRKVGDALDRLYAATSAYAAALGAAPTTRRA